MSLPLSVSLSVFISLSPSLCAPFYHHPTIFFARLSAASLPQHHSLSLPLLRVLIGFFFSSSSISVTGHVHGGGRIFPFNATQASRKDNAPAHYIRKYVI